MNWLSPLIVGVCGGFILGYALEPWIRDSRLTRWLGMDPPPPEPRATDFPWTPEEIHRYLESVERL